MIVSLKVIQCFTRSSKALKQALAYFTKAFVVRLLFQPPTASNVCGKSQVLGISENDKGFGGDRLRRLPFYFWRNVAQQEPVSQLCQGDAAVSCGAAIRCRDAPDGGGASGAPFLAAGRDAMAIPSSHRDIRKSK